MKWECAVKKCQLTSLTWVFGLCKYTFKVFASIMKYASSGSRALKMASVAEAGVVVQDANALLLHLLLLLHSVWAIKGVEAETPIYQCYLASSKSSSPTQKFKRRQDSFFLFSGSTLSAPFGNRKNMRPNIVKLSWGSLHYLSRSQEKKNL